MQVLVLSVSVLWLCFDLQFEKISISKKKGINLEHLVYYFAKNLLCTPIGKTILYSLKSWCLFCNNTLFIPNIGFS